ncbi:MULTISPECIES: LysR family transcriptional regulator [unclassified Pseudomonas]|uniref:LysR family transcriptional regulator n=1 Tax=unclassified Pseudomonas TaxID=196821 RepID=UPI000C887054|nr:MULTISPECIES: LysR family transcriptional regulator [unclassified Pseudomonas]PNA00470.1 LysR family transcriptional regulator [Pseudomonas sp. FW305-42]PNA25354.1 LysR family transcriptional regulator [Pseudomonas sp. MPR-R1B]PNB25929.1 LysR family transcriptional regulator [Pseudomonas sp. DP16D-E2]PNB43745.1 LysR family transcriptional regulator [Pseudomonas sp. FW305-17]PNB62475.1 LysR family transcriptional regulator [Pseudomonas sp. GW531-E2]
MEFKQLRSFIEVVHKGGFTQAAGTLHVSQSAVSKQVAQLEQDIGQPLLERQGSQLLLTAAGRIVLERGEALLRQRQELLSELDDLSQMARGELRLGLPLLGSDALFAGLFAEYRRRHPNISIQLLEGGSRMVEQAVKSGELELGGSLTPNDPAFDYQPFCNEPLEALLPAGHPLAGQVDVALAQLADTPFLLYQRSFVLNDRLLSACQQEGFTPKEGGRSGQADFLAALVAAGQGVVLLPAIVARALERPGVVRLPLRAPEYLRWDIAFIWRRGAYLSRAAQAWLALLREDSAMH